jgi:Raf kinase inhibitor-like YbhB/YbcL family protein
MELRSDSFPNGGRIPKAYVMRAIGGENRSPHFRWSEPPAGTKSFVLSITDPHPIASNWMHWIVIDLPADARGLPEGASGRAMPAGSRELRNGFGARGYGGPQPPAGSGEHPYLCTLFALSVAKMDLPERVTWAQIQKALAGKVLAQATITGKYSQ